MTAFTPRPRYRWRIAGGRTIELGAVTRIMGILNVTPDSFSDGGRHFEFGAAVQAARLMIAEGADLIDVGGESTRPGAPPVPAAEELRRVVPVIRELAPLGVPISIDTRKAEVARAALDAGAAVVNDVSGLRFDPALAPFVAGRAAGLVLMHSRATPLDMQAQTRYDHVVPDVVEEIEEACQRAMAAQISPETIVVDPGLGFAKTAGQNLALLGHLDLLVSRGRPVMVGGSRKSFIGKILDDRPVADRLAGSVAVAVMAAAAGAHLVRVHDVGATRDALRVTDAVLESLNGYEKSA